MILGILSLLMLTVSVGCEFDDPSTLNISSPANDASKSQTKGSTNELLDSGPADIYAFDLFDIDGKPVSLNRFRGKVLLVVNTASRCGYTPQYGHLQILYERYRDQGLEILAFPSNDFGGQELATNEEVALFCYTRYAVDFPLFAKTRIRGTGKHPLYQYLTEDSPFPGEVRWNFEKFLVNDKGLVVARYPSAVVPLSDEIVGELTRILPKT